MWKVNCDCNYRTLSHLPLVQDFEEILVYCFALTVSAFLWNMTDILSTVLLSSNAAARLFHSRSNLAAWIRMVFCA